MKKNNVLFISLTITITLVIFLAGAFAINFFVKEELSAEDTTKEFLTTWISYEGNPLIDRIYRNNPHVSSEFSQKLDMMIDSFETTAYDPVLCSQSVPSDIKIANTSIKENSAVITVDELFFGNSKMTEIILHKTGDTWLINDIVCNEEEKRDDSNSPVSPAIISLVGDYISENISELSPKEAPLGGNFYVTSIGFTGPTSCIVEYEDGHIALTAKAEFTVSEEGKVTITSFKLEDTINTDDFARVGNLTKNNGEWNLVYEEPGKPALTAELEFDNNSLCLESFEKKTCSSEYWEVGDRAEILGERQGEVVVVSSLRIVDEAPDTVGGGNGFCENQCGDGVCAEVVCMGEGCPCAETVSSCPQDCSE